MSSRFVKRRLRPVGHKVAAMSIGEALGIGRVSRDCAPRLPAFPNYDASWFDSGTSALAAACLEAVVRRPVSEPEIIIPAYACPDIVAAAVHAGARPVLADTSPDLPWLDPASLRSLIGPRTVAVIYVRFLGLPANDREIARCMDRDDILLIEDLAHAYPSANRVESSADMAVLSFGRGKPVSLRLGGVLLRRSRPTRGRAVDVGLNESALGFRLTHWLRCHLFNLSCDPRLYALVTRYTNVPIDAIRYRPLSAIGAFPRSLVPALIRAIEDYERATIVAQNVFRSSLALHAPAADLLKLVASRDAGRCSADARDVRIWRYPLLLPSESSRDKLYDELAQKGLGPSRMYRKTLDEIPDTAPRVAGGDTRGARAFARRLLTLPVHAGVQPAQLREIIDCVNRHATVH